MTVKRSAWLRLGLVAPGLAVAAMAFSQARPATGPDAAQLIQFLNRTISWYRELRVQQAAATEPDDQVIVYNNRQVADQVVRLAFEFARAQADAIAKRAASGQATGADPRRSQALQQMEAKIEKQRLDTEGEMNAARRELATATGRRRQQLESQVVELQSELNLAAARQDAVRGMAEFVTGASVGGVSASGLRAEIEALAGSVPAAALPAASNVSGGAPATPPVMASPAISAGGDESGVWGLVDEAFVLSGRIDSIEAIIQQTDALSKASRDLRAPFITELREVLKKGDELAVQADTTDPALLAQVRKQLDQLAERFRQTSSAVTPLSKQSVLLNLYGRNLATWHDALTVRYRADLKRLGIRLGVVSLLLAAVFGAGALWRRGVYRYVHESRRRYQLLLLRKLAMWSVVALVLAFTLASKVGSLLTFAGLLTAGVAVALQSVVLAVVGYFLLIGKFGIRVGDRVQIGGVTGEVIDLGLVRMHLMELSGGGFDAPTGRVVAFSNSVVFQAGAGLFKQIPGTSFVWHEIAVTVPRGADFAPLKEALLGAVTAVLSDHRAEFQRQYREMERTVVSIPSDALEPGIRLRATPSGIEIVIRFPVDVHHGAEIDERVSRAVLAAVESTSGPNAAGSNAPEIHLRTDVSLPDATR